VVQLVVQRLRGTVAQDCRCFGLVAPGKLQHLHDVLFFHLLHALEMTPGTLLRRLVDGGWEIPGEQHLFARRDRRLDGAF
jgi:hypothetical protein